MPAPRLRGSSFFLNPQFIQQHLIQQNLANLAVDFPDLFVERRHHSLVFVENSIREFAQLLLERFAIEFG